jgi:acetylornithine/succinyldiaminopimelate/putrescine aminotransferase
VVEEYKDKLGLRGKGLFIGFDVKNGSEFAGKMVEKGYFVNIIKKNTVRLLPPYILREEDLRNFFETAKELI